MDCMESGTGTSAKVVCKSTGCANGYLYNKDRLDCETACDGKAARCELTNGDITKPMD